MPFWLLPRAVAPLCPVDSKGCFPERGEDTALEALLLLLRLRTGEKDVELATGLGVARGRRMVHFRGLFLAPLLGVPLPLRSSTDLPALLLLPASTSHTLSTPLPTRFHPSSGAPRLLLLLSRLHKCSRLTTAPASSSCCCCCCSSCVGGRALIVCTEGRRLHRCCRLLPCCWAAAATGALLASESKGPKLLRRRARLSSLEGRRWGSGTVTGR